MNNLTHDNLIELVIAWTKLALGDENFLIIRGFQNGHSPETPHGVLYTTDKRTTGMLAQTNIQISDDEIEINNHGVTNTEMHLRFIGDGSVENADKVYFFTNTQASKSFLFGKGMSIRTPQEWRFVPKLFDEGSLDATEIILRLQSTVDYVETVGVIENTELIIKN